jgi:hypothetical protein
VYFKPVLGGISADPAGAGFAFGAGQSECDHDGSSVSDAVPVEQHHWLDCPFL